ncbi:hypothetical protein V9T40_005922 [Parthenolecanium corni]|uniref:Tubulin alpha chain n=1 Tax=Parthenolecanium corni TaxID=536013 RepID=A0AAN9TV15_9HEMI
MMLGVNFFSCLLTTVSLLQQEGFFDSLIFSVKQEIISIHIGQAGIQIGSACWELYCIEHGIWPDGFKSDYTENTCSPHEISFGSFFDETDFGRYVPRAVFVDLEPLVVDEIRNNQYKYLFRPSSLVSGKEDAANNYARGYYTIGREVIKTVAEAIRREVNQCDSLDGFFFFHSMGGGTGSGLSTLILESLSEDYVKKKQLEFVVYPSPRLATATVEPYNAVLSTNGSIDLTDCVFLIDNEALYNICSLKLDIEDPTYTSLNRILGQVISSLTAAMRFDGSINVDLSEFQTNLVPFPRIHFPLITYAPFLSSYRASHERITIKQVTRLCFEPSNQLLKCDTNRGKYMACVLLYRGIIPPADITTSLNIIRKSRIPFVNWCPTGFKVGINFQPPSSFPDSTIAASHLGLCTIANTTAISEAWARIDYKFDLMFSKRCFVHWYLGEGMDEQEFMDARENLAALEKDYYECISESPVEQSTLKTSPRGRKLSSLRSIPTPASTTSSTRKTASPATRITASPATRGTASSTTRRAASPGTRRTASPGTRRTASPGARKTATPKARKASPGRKKSASPKRPKSPKSK